METEEIRRAEPWQLRQWVAVELGYPCYTCREWADTKTCSFFPLGFRIPDWYEPCSPSDYTRVMYYQDFINGCIPNWPIDIDAAYALEDTINSWRHRRRYTTALTSVLQYEYRLVVDSRGLSDHAIAWLRIHATAEQRTRAWLLALSYRG